MGHFNASGNQQIVESITNAFGGHGIYSTPAYWQGYLYFWAPNDVLRVFQMMNGLVSTTTVATGSVTFGSPGATPAVSSNSGSNGIVWAVQPDGYGTGAPAVLHALNATTAVELYNSTQAGKRDTAGPAIKFTPPTVANGKVYVPTASELDVYGLLP
jgi:outer membrane protein assembly factor BamB